MSCCTAAMAVGQMVRLWMSDPGDGSLMGELHGNRVAVAPEFYGETRFGVRVRACVRVC